jgi:hypothetical protein
MNLADVKCTCGAKMIWGGSHESEEVEEGYVGTVHNLSCSRIGCWNRMLFYEVMKE